MSMPIFAKCIHSPYFGKIYIPLIFSKFIPLPRMFVHFTFLWLHLHSFASPYFDHDVFMHHALHLLSASVPRGNRIPLKRETAALSACKASYSFVVTMSATPPWIIMRQSFIGKKRVTLDCVKLRHDMTLEHFENITFRQLSFRIFQKVDSLVYHVGRNISPVQ